MSVHEDILLDIIGTLILVNAMQEEVGYMSVNSILACSPTSVWLCNPRTACNRVSYTAERHIY